MTYDDSTEVTDELEQFDEEFAAAPIEERSAALPEKAGD